MYFEVALYFSKFSLRPLQHGMNLHQIVVKIAPLHYVYFFLIKGVDRLVRDNVYTAAFPLHEVSEGSLFISLDVHSPNAKI